MFNRLRSNTAINAIASTFRRADQFAGRSWLHAASVGIPVGVAGVMAGNAIGAAIKGDSNYLAPGRSALIGGALGATAYPFLRRYR